MQYVTVQELRKLEFSHHDTTEYQPVTMRACSIATLAAMSANDKLSLANIEMSV